MNEKTKFVFNGFLELNSSEQQDFINNLNDYVKKGDWDKSTFKRDINSTVKNRVTLGPLSEGCPCCGKS